VRALLRLNKPKKEDAPMETNEYISAEKENNEGFTWEKESTNANVSITILGYYQEKAARAFYKLHP
jgi:hypothetical protein